MEESKMSEDLEAEEQPLETADEVEEEAEEEVKPEVAE